MEFSHEKCIKLLSLSKYVLVFNFPNRGHPRNDWEKNQKLLPFPDSSHQDSPDPPFATKIWKEFFYQQPVAISFSIQPEPEHNLTLLLTCSFEPHVHLINFFFLFSTLRFTNKYQLPKEKGVKKPILI